MDAMYTRTTFSPNTESKSDLLINDYEYSGPAELESEIITALIRYAKSVGKNAVIINTTEEGVEDLLKDLDFEIVEEYGNMGLTTGVYEIQDATDNSTITTADKPVAELIDLWQRGEIGLNEADSIEQQSADQIKLTFEGSDGKLPVNYTLAEDQPTSKEASDPGYSLFAANRP